MGLDDTSSPSCQSSGSEARICCKECGNPHLIRDAVRAELICSNCGLVIEERQIDMGQEWRAFDIEQRERRSRVGIPLTYTIHDKGLSTMIDWRNQDYSGKNISGNSRATLYRLRKWQKRMRVSDAIERNLAFALSELERLCSQLDVSRNIKEQAALIYRKALEKRYIKGRNIESVITAALYIACRQNRVPRTLEEIAYASKSSKKEIGRNYRFLIKNLMLNVPNRQPVDFIFKIGEELKLKHEIIKQSIKIIDESIKCGLLSGRGPMGICAASIYIACILNDDRRTQSQVAKAAGITEVTIRNRYKEICSRLNIKLEV
ncbi:MAG: transcription initiation factor IIB [Candidatus Helarchaeales archaeon]